MTPDFVRISDFELDEPVTAEMLAELTGANVSIVVRLARHGLLEVISEQENQLFLPRRALLQLRKMLRLRRDLRVNFAGASLALELVEQIEEMRRELSELRSKLER